MSRMRPHTRTQCQDQPQGSQCPECREIPTQSTSTQPPTSGLPTKDDPFLAPISTVSRGRPSVSGTSTASYHIDNGVSLGSAKRVLLLTELPAEILFKILSYMSFKEISHLRTVIIRSYAKKVPKLDRKLYLIKSYSILFKL